MPVSPFIHKEEKAIRDEAEALGRSMLLFIHEAFPEYLKPVEHEFNPGSSGHLPIISIGEPECSELSRELRQRMNSLAEEIDAGLYQKDLTLSASEVFLHDERREIPLSS